MARADLEAALEAKVAASQPMMTRATSSMYQNVDSMLASSAGINTSPTIKLRPSQSAMVPPEVQAAAGMGPEQLPNDIATSPTFALASSKLPLIIGGVAALGLVAFMLTRGRGGSMAGYSKRKSRKARR